MNKLMMLFDNRFICSVFIYYFAVTMICPNHLGRKSIFAFSVTPDPHMSSACNRALYLALIYYTYPTCQQDSVGHYPPENAELL